MLLGIHSTFKDSRPTAKSKAFKATAGGGPKKKNGKKNRLAGRKTQSEPIEMTHIAMTKIRRGPHCPVCGAQEVMETE